MQWKGKVLYVGKRKYVFKQKIRNSGKAGECMAVVFRRDILFIEKSGEFVRHSTKRIYTSEFLKNGVVYAEVGESEVKYITHPYDAVEKMDVGTKSFHVCAANKTYFCIIKFKEEKYILKIYKGVPPKSKCVLRLLVPENPLKIVFKDNRLTVATSLGITMYLLGKNSPASELLCIKRKTRCLLGQKIESVHSVDIGRVHLLLVNEEQVLDGKGIAMQLSRIPQKEKLQQIKASALWQIKRLVEGYQTQKIHGFFQYDTKGQKALAKSLPWQARMHVHRQKSIYPELLLDHLFQRAIVSLSPRSLIYTARCIERYIHILRYHAAFRSPLFLEVSRCLLPHSPKHARIALLLAPEEYFTPEEDIYSYELILYKEKYLKHSKSIGYAFICADAKGKEEIGKISMDKQMAHTLEDPEYIREVPMHMQSTNAIAECKELLSGYRVGDFPFDEYDTENKRKKAFVFSVITSVGRGVFLFSRNQYINIFQIPTLKVFLKKNNSMISIASLSENDKIWPSFHFAVSTVLSVPNTPFISTEHVEVFTLKEVMSLAGSIFGMGLKHALHRNKLTSKERASLVKTLLLSLSRSNNSILIGAAILGDAFIMQGLGDKKLADIIQYNLKTPKNTSAMLMWNVLGLGILFMGKDDLFARNLLMEYMDRRGAIVGTGENELARTLYYDKYHRVAAAFALSYVCIGMLPQPYIRIADRTCELIVNGLLHIGTQKEKTALFLDESSLRATPVNRFYSSLMKALVMGVPHKNTSCTLKEAFAACFKKALFAQSIEDAYAVAGEIFAYGILHIPKGGRPCTSFTTEITELLYALERMPEASSVLLDYALLSACLALNSTGDLCVLGTCKRFLSSLQSIAHLGTITEYSIFAGEYREQYGMRYGRIQHIKMCLSLLAPGCGWMCVDTTPQAIAFLITSFYVEQPILPEDQDAFQVVRHFYTLSLVPRASEEEEECINGVALTHALKSMLVGATQCEIKIALDIISTYFEKYKAHVFSPNMLEEAIEEIYTLKLENRLEK